jgi:hypothetical protein
MGNISYNLDLVTPIFIDFIKNINMEFSQWIQYNGIELENDTIYFKFKSSQNSLNFKVYGGLNNDNIYYLLKGKTSLIFNHFENVKNQNLKP